MISNLNILEPNQRPPDCLFFSCREECSERNVLDRLGQIYNLCNSGAGGDEMLVKGGVIGRSSVSEESKRGDVCRDRRPSEESSSGDNDCRSLMWLTSQGTGDKMGVIGVDVE
jgi:hypothetical protein